MRIKSKLVISTVIVTMAAGAAVAQTGTPASGNANWMPIGEVTAKVAAMGYTVHEIETDDGQWEVHAEDSSGAYVELTLDRASGEVVRQRPDNDDDRRGSTGDWLPVADVLSGMEGMGYTVRSIDRDDGRYEVSGIDANGAEIEIHLDPATGEPMTRNR